VPTVIDIYSKTLNKLEISKQNSVLHETTLNKHKIQPSSFLQLDKLAHALKWTYGVEYNDFRRKSNITVEIPNGHTLPEVTVIATGHCQSRYLYQVCALDLCATKSNYNVNFYGLRSNFSTGTVYLPRHAASAINISHCFILSLSWHPDTLESHIENDSRRTKSNTAVSAGRS